MPPGVLQHVMAMGIERRKNPLTIELAKEARVNPENPVDPVKNKFLAEKTIEDVFLHFGDNLGEARRRYRQFVKNGIDQGKRPDFQIKSQKSKISKDRSIICYLAIKEMKYSGASVGKFLNIKRYSAL